MHMVSSRWFCLVFCTRYLVPDLSFASPRIMQRKLKGYWVVRFKNGAYLIDEKYFTPIEQTL